MISESACLFQDVMSTPDSNLGSTVGGGSLFFVSKTVSHAKKAAEWKEIRQKRRTRIAVSESE